MKKRVRILISLLMISGSLTITSKSYAESEDFFTRKNLIRLSCVSAAGLTVSASWVYFMKRAVKAEALKRVVTANRAYKIGHTGLRALKKEPTFVEGSLLTTLTGYSIVSSAVCAALATISSASVSEIIENPSLAMQNDEKFRLLVESVGVDPALELVGRIADGEDPEKVMNTLASLLEQNSNTEKDSFLDSGHEEELGAQ